MSMSESRLDYVSAGRTGLRCILGRLRAGGMSFLIVGCSTDRALMPVSVLVAFPSGFVGMSYCTSVVTDITSSIASVVVNVVALVDLNAAHGALVPMLIVILVPCGLIAVGYSARVTAGITGSIASVIKYVSRFIALCAATALVPVIVSIGLPIVSVIMRVSKSCLYNVTAGSTSLCRVFGCRCTGSMSFLTVGSSADRAFVPVTVLVIFPGRFVAMCYAPDVTAGVTGSVASIIVNVVALVYFHAANRALAPMLV